MENIINLYPTSALYVKKLINSFIFLKIKKEEQHYILNTNTMFVSLNACGKNPFHTKVDYFPTSVLFLLYHSNMPVIHFFFIYE